LGHNKEEGETWRSARPGLVSPLATARCFSTKKSWKGKKNKIQKSGGEKKKSSDSAENPLGGYIYVYTQYPLTTIPL
jgi:hypothetical protein